MSVAQQFVTPKVFMWGDQPNGVAPVPNVVGIVTVSLRYDANNVPGFSGASPQRAAQVAAQRIRARLGEEGESSLQSDVNHDGEVNENDLLLFVSSWTDGVSAGDSNVDEVVDVDDLARFLNAYSTGD